VRGRVSREVAGKEGFLHSRKREESLLLDVSFLGRKTPEPREKERPTFAAARKEGTARGRTPEFLRRED